MKNTYSIFTAIIILVISLLSVNPLTTLAESTDLTQSASNSETKITAALINGQTNGQFDVTELNYQQVSNLIKEILNDHPEILYLKSWRTSSNGTIEFNYSVPLSTVLANQKALQQEVDSVLSTIIKPGFTDFDKVKAIHDYLALHTAYDYDNLLKNTVPADSYSAYGSLLKGVAVCDGYTKAAQLMMNRLGIENDYVDGYGNGGLHSWNLVVLDGQHYFMDITWDDPVPNTPGYVRYKYFLVTSEELRKDHSWIEENWPIATSTKYQYFDDFFLMRETESLFIYSSESDSHKLYRIAKDGRGKMKISDLRAPYFALYGEWIYFSNYSASGRLYKMKQDGTEVSQLNSVHSTDLSIEGSTLSFVNYTTKKTETIHLEKTVTPIGKIVPTNKVWTITFNNKVDKQADFSQSIQVKSESGESIPVTYKVDATEKKVLVSPSTIGYKPKTNYILTIENVKGQNGQTQKKKETQQFHTQ